MPYPSQINEEVILDIAKQMIRVEGVDRFSLNQLAKELGVKTPSLYRYFQSKTDLLRAINLQTRHRVYDALQTGLDAEGDAFNRIMICACAYRRYALDNPLMYDLAFTNTLPALNADAQMREDSALPYQALVAEISGQENALPALRGLFAMIHGYVTLEMAGQFQRGGDLDDAYKKSVRAYLLGWQHHESIEQA